MKSTTLPFLLLSLAPLAARAEDWPQWRGPDRTNVSKESGLLKSWPKDGPKLAWDAKGAGRGYGSVAVSKGKVFLLGDGLSTADDKDEYVVCLDEQTGKHLWATKTGPAWNSGQPSWQSSRSTPTLDGNHLYVITPHGVLVCLETGKGELKWKADLKKDFKGNKGDGWGYSESPLLDGDKVVCTPGGGTVMVALNKATGAVVWKCEGNHGGAGHASVVPSEIGQTRVYVNTTARKVVGVRADDGKLLWSFDHPGSTAVIPTPIVRGDLVFYAAGYGKGGGLLRQVPFLDGAVKVEEVYKQQRNMTNKHGGILLMGDHLYGCGEDSNSLWCADLKSGQEVWKERVTGRGSVSLTAAEGKLYLHVSDGTVSLVEAKPVKGGFKEISTFKAPGSGARPSWAHPIIANGRLYIRETDRVLAYDVKDSASSRR